MRGSLVVHLHWSGKISQAAESERHEHQLVVGVQDRPLALEGWRLVGFLAIPGVLDGMVVLQLLELAVGGSGRVGVERAVLKARHSVKGCYLILINNYSTHFSLYLSLFN